MKNESLSAEERILDAATQNFLFRGYAGARMQQIANDAGVNKALLHYYFENKEVLFKRVMEDALAGFGSIAGVLLEKEAGTLQQRLSLLTERFLQILLRKPFLPGFVLQEAQQHPEIMYPILKQYEADLGALQLEINAEAAAGRMQPVEARELIVNMFSVCFFPFLAMPLLSQVLYAEADEALGSLLNQRRKAVEELVLTRVFNL